MLKNLALQKGMELVIGSASKIDIVNAISKRLPDTLIKHHIFTNKHFKKYTDEFKLIVSKYGLKLNQAWNIVEIPLKYHRGRHATDYHDFVLEQANIIDGLANGNKSRFLELVNSRIISKLLANPNILNKK